MSDDKDNQALDNYLQGGTPLSRQYRAGAQEQPPAHLDAAIISAATKAVTAKPSGGRQWYVPLSLAAVVVISFGLVFRVYQSVPQPEPEPELAAPAASEYRLKDAPSEDTMPAKRTENFEREVQKARSMEADDTAAKMKKKQLQQEKTLRREAPAALDYSDAVPGEAAAGAASMSAPAPEALQPLPEAVTEERDDIAARIGERKPLQPQQWFEIINQLWFDGDKAGAMNAVQRFLEAYPDYPEDELRKMLPPDMDLSKPVQ